MLIDGEVPAENALRFQPFFPPIKKALKTTPTPDLKRQWRDLFETEPPPYNRRFLESRLAYRIQELAYGGLKPETIARLEALGQQLDGASSPVSLPGQSGYFLVRPFARVPAVAPMRNSSRLRSWLS
jgi:Protein of unknown function (DUF2924)